MLSRASEYAIRALTYLAQKPRGSYYLARAMGEELGIPAPFLAKILQPMVTRGLVESQRGRHGGFRLARAANEITLDQIVASQEQLDRLSQCLLGQGECSDEVPCPLHDFWKHASTEFLETFARTSLADLANFTQNSPQTRYPLPRLGLAEGTESDGLGVDGQRQLG